MTPEVNFAQPSKSRSSNEEPSRSNSSNTALSVKAEQPASSSTSIFLQWNVSTLQDSCLDPYKAGSRMVLKKKGFKSGANLYNMVPMIYYNLKSKNITYLMEEVLILIHPPRLKTRSSGQPSAKAMTPRSVTCICFVSGPDLCILQP